MRYYESAKYTAKVVDIYKSSLEFEEDFFVKSSSFYDEVAPTYSASSTSIFLIRR